jgi:cyclic lactone autoinducer peptide
MLKLLAKVAEKYARATNTASISFIIWHQPKMPASLVKKD